MAQTLGLDVSHHSGVVDFNKAGEAGVRFVFIRSSQGTTTDTRFRENWKNAARAGIPRGAYHYLRNDIPAIEQAQYFCSLHPKGELPPVVDVEESVGEAGIHMFLLYVQTCLNHRPVIYTSNSKWPGPFYWSSRYDLWVANYETESPLVPEDWYDEWTFWQYTDQAPGEDYGVMDNTADLNWFNGSYADLQYYIARVDDRSLTRVRFNEPERIKVVPPDATPAEASYIMLEALREKTSVVQSFDRATRGVVELYKIPDDQHRRFDNWYRRHYPNVVRVVLRTIPPNVEDIL